MLNQFSRFELLVGKDNIEKLKNKKVAVFGLGGVGGFTVEALVRSGISNFVLIDNDKFSLTNLNRQILATQDTINRDKVEVCKERILSINPLAKVETIAAFYLPENRDVFDFSSYDYVVDAIDTVTAKIDIIQRCKEMNIPIISSMGTGNKLDPTKLVVTDIYKTEMDPLAKVMRHELRKRNIDSLKVVYSTEKPIELNKEALEEYLKEESNSKRSIPGSSCFVPPVAGIIIASEVIKDLLGI